MSDVLFAAFSASQKDQSGELLLHPASVSLTACAKTKIASKAKKERDENPLVF